MTEALTVCGILLGLYELNIAYMIWSALRDGADWPSTLDAWIFEIIILHLLPLAFGLSLFVDFDHEVPCAGCKRPLQVPRTMFLTLWVLTHRHLDGAWPIVCRWCDTAWDPRGSPEEKA